MNTFRFIFLLSIISLMSTSCYRRNGWGVRGTGSDVTENRPLYGFDRIHLSTDAEVEYVQDSLYFFEVTGQANVLQVLKTEVKNSILKIGFNSDVWDHHTIKIKVHSPHILEFEISGSGDIKSFEAIDASSLECNISGSGNIVLSSLTANSAFANISGSGNVDLGSGTVTNEDFHISGSGNIESLNLLSTKANAEISGSGNISLNVVDDLKVSISGSGDVKYKGRPAVNTSISGSGRLIHLN